jgi:hypothetical protein
MATSTANGFLFPASAKATSSARPSQKRRRRISPQAGHALMILGHAIEYLTDEFANEGGSFSAYNDRLAAVRLLMERNRQVYYECPELPTLAERWNAFLHPKMA